MRTRRAPLPVPAAVDWTAVAFCAWLSVNINDFALIALLGLLALRIFETCGANIADRGERHGHRVLRVRGKVVLIPLPPAVSRAIDRALDGRVERPILRNTLGGWMDRHAACRWLRLQLRR